jgi:hypothetical protein
LSGERLDVGVRESSWPQENNTRGIFFLIDWVVETLGSRSHWRKREDGEAIEDIRIREGQRCEEVRVEERRSRR